MDRMRRAIRDQRYRLSAHAVEEIWKALFYRGRFGGDSWTTPEACAIRFAAEQRTDEADVLFVVSCLRGRCW